MPDEAIYAVRALGLWQHGTLPLFGRPAPATACSTRWSPGCRCRSGARDGLRAPEGRAGARHLARGVPVFAYTRRLMPDGYALLAAALTLACPLVLFSGFVMTEVLYYPLAAAALLAIARAVDDGDAPRPGDRARADRAAVATRVQASCCSRSSRRDRSSTRRSHATGRTLRAFWPVWALAVAGALVAARPPGRVRRVRGDGQRRLQRRRRPRA